ncbi:hypothetical protein BH11MYX3_BH11MYX3_01170 [soil metagenome]
MFLRSTLGQVPFVGPMLSTWRGCGIAAFVAIQLLLPISYYTRKDPHDERFAWRMFSPMRMARCRPTATINDAPFNLAGEFHEAWLEIASRGRFKVIEAMATRLCAEHPNSAVRISIDCTYVDREPRSYGGYDMCNVPEL